MQKILYGSVSSSHSEEKMIWADLHTHTEYSHDSVCPVREMALAQRERGAALFAVTDHFDTHSYLRYDVHTPILRSCLEAQELNEELGPDFRVLKGVEISEGFWHPEVYRSLMESVSFDVVLGSVHLVRFKGMETAYSGLDFSRCEPSVVSSYTDAYFDDVLTLLDTVDFDVLCHLTCPLKYIRGRYGIVLEEERYLGKIHRILEKVIKKGVALEVNTSALSILGDLMPKESILKLYYDLGGRLVTLGSDAHTAGRASEGIATAVNVLKKIGFSHTYYFLERKPVAIPLE